MTGCHPIIQYVGISRNRFRFIWSFFHVNHNHNNDLQDPFDREQTDIEVQAEVEDDVIGQEEEVEENEGEAQRLSHTFLMYLDPMHLSIDEMMIRFSGRCVETHRMKNKPITNRDMC
jgi:hypothetical protein